MRLIRAFLLASLQVTATIATSCSSSSSSPKLTSRLQTLPDELVLEIAKKLTNINDVHALTCSIESPLVTDYVIKSHEIMLSCGHETYQLLFDNPAYVLSHYTHEIIWNAYCISALHTFLTSTKSFAFKRTAVSIQAYDASYDLPQMLRDLKELLSLPSMKLVDINLIYSLIKHAPIDPELLNFRLKKLVDHYGRFAIGTRNTSLLESYVVVTCDVSLMRTVTSTLKCNQIILDPHQHTYPNRFFLDLVYVNTLSDAEVAQFQSIDLTVDVDRHLWFSDSNGINRIIPKIRRLEFSYMYEAYENVRQRINDINVQMLSINQMELEEIIFSFEEGCFQCGLIASSLFKVTEAIVIKIVKVFYEGGHDNLIRMLDTIAHSLLNGLHSWGNRCARVEIFMDVSRFDREHLLRIARVIEPLGVHSFVTLNRFPITDAVTYMRRLMH